MIRRWCGFSFFALLALFMPADAQAPAPQSLAKLDSQEPAIIQEMSTKVAFDNEGLSTREQSTRVRVQTDSGVQQWGLLNLPFQSATQAVEISYVRVRKPDGGLVITPPDNVQDLDAEITRSAPFYSDLREKHVAVKGLGKRDILEYEVRWRSNKALIPGQFWFQYNFQKNVVVLDERLEIRVPSGRAVKVKGPQETQAVRTEADTRIYSWTYSKLQSTKDAGSNQKKETETALGRLPAPDVQLSSFQSWEEVGSWYWNLQKERVEPTAAIRAKAAELTKGMTDDAAKLQALYSFVSLQYRYIGIAFGIGRYQPHAAEDVLTNNYGDCKDKHTLLTSLLQAAGITLYPALITSSWKLDPDVPMPGQFDHIIGYLPPGKDTGKDGEWLDTTPEVAPFGYLVLQLRDKQALVMTAEKSAQLITTPADPPVVSDQAFKIEGKLSDNGTFDAKIVATVRGDREVPVRSAFRRLPQSQWKDLVQGISYAMGFAGTVSDIDASAPAVTNEPFHFSYAYSRKDYPDWSNHQFTVPGLPFLMPQLKDDADYPVWLGSPQEAVSDSKVELPKGYRPQAPADVDLKYDFAEYHAAYSQDQGVLIAKRRLLIKKREVPVSEFDDYRSFVKNMQNDVDRYVQTSTLSATPTSNSPLSGSMPPFLSAILQMRESSSSEANRLEADGRTAARLGDRSAAQDELKKAVETDPKFARAWVELASLQLASGMSDSALESLRKAIDSDPNELISRKVYAFLLSGLRRPEAAMDAWRAIREIAPDDPEANSGMGLSLVQQKRYREAVAYLEVAAKVDHTPVSQFRLGSAYLRGGEIEKGAATLDKIVESDPKSELLNDVAYELAETNVNLPKALEYAERAVNKLEKESYDVELSNLLPEDLKCTQKIGNTWDTVGWIHFRLGHLDKAESYLQAAWLLSQASVIADHLGQMFEQEQKTEKAIHLYRLALASPEFNGGSWEETRHRLEHLTGTKAPTTRDRMIGGDPSGADLSQLRSVKLKRLVAGSATAEFFLLVSPGPKVTDVQFVSGSEKLKSAGQALSEAHFQMAFPEGSSARLVRRAILSCSPVTGCAAVLFTPDSVRSVK